MEDDIKDFIEDCEEVGFDDSVMDQICKAKYEYAMKNGKFPLFVCMNEKHYVGLLDELQAMDLFVSKHTDTTGKKSEFIYDMEIIHSFDNEISVMRYCEGSFYSADKKNLH